MGVCCGAGRDQHTKRSAAAEHVRPQPVVWQNQTTALVRSAATAGTRYRQCIAAPYGHVSKRLRRGIRTKLLRICTPRQSSGTTCCGGRCTCGDGDESAPGGGALSVTVLFNQKGLTWIRRPVCCISPNPPQPWRTPWRRRRMSESCAASGNRTTWRTRCVCSHLVHCMALRSAATESCALQRRHLRLLCALPGCMHLRQAHAPLTLPVPPATATLFNLFDFASQPHRSTWS